jgi:hypothetical protein
MTGSCVYTTSMNKRLLIAGGALLAVVFVGASIYFLTKPKPPSDEFQVRSVVNGLGDVIVNVSLATTTEAIAASMDEYYALYVRPDLLETWKADPSKAPTRPAVGPRPDYIAIDTVVKNEDGTYTIQGDIVIRAVDHASSTAAARTPVRFILSQGPDGWQISGYEVRSPSGA